MRCEMLLGQMVVGKEMEAFTESTESKYKK